MNMELIRARVLLPGESLVNQALQTYQVKLIAAYFKRLALEASLVHAEIFTGHLCAIGVESLGTPDDDKLARGLRSKRVMRVAFIVEGFYFFISFKYFPHSASPFEVEIRALS
jgi:hypothetical protein